MYGDDAIVIYGHVQKGSRIGVQGHIQMRTRANSDTPVFEVVAEHIEFIRNIDYERGSRAIVDLKRSKGQMDESFEYPAVPVTSTEESITNGN